MLNGFQLNSSQQVTILFTFRPDDANKTRLAEH